MAGRVRQRDYEVAVCVETQAGEWQSLKGRRHDRGNRFRMWGGRRREEMRAVERDDAALGDRNGYRRKEGRRALEARRSSRGRSGSHSSVYMKYDRKEAQRLRPTAVVPRQEDAIAVDDFARFEQRDVDPSFVLLFVQNLELTFLCQSFRDPTMTWMKHTERAIEIVGETAKNLPRSGSRPRWQHLRPSPRRASKSRYSPSASEVTAAKDSKI
jgi:hypothetical protein